MKKLMAILLTFVIALSCIACNKDTQTVAPEPLPTALPTEAPTIAEPVSTEGISISDSSEDALESQIESEVNTVLLELTAEFDALSACVTDYQSYTEKADQIEAFYEKVNSVSASLCHKMRLYSIAYAQNLLSSGKSTDDMYDDMEWVYDVIYDDMGDEIYDGIYDGILDDVYDAFYDGALDDRPDDVEYADWSDARSKEYELWSDSRSETYEHWSDFRSDVYDFWSDMRGEFWDYDLDGAQEEMEDFRQDVEKLTSATNETPTDATEEAPTETVTETPSGIRPEFKETMDSYEKFFDEYVAFMKAYKESDNPLSMINEYTSMMQTYTETMTQLQNLDQSELSTEETLYYTEVMMRINQKLLDAV